MNPCPCGWLGHASGRCRCTPDRVARYRARISGPLLDRIDLAIEVPALPAGELDAESPGELASAEVRRGSRTRARDASSRARASSTRGWRAGELKRHAAPDAAGHALALRAIAQLALSARAYHRILKVARTIADLAGSDAIAAGARRRGDLVPAIRIVPTGPSGRGTSRPRRCAARARSASAAAGSSCTPRTRRAGCRHG